MSTNGRAPTGRIVYFEAPGEVSVRTERITPRDGEELVRSQIIGISHGTEMLFYRGPFPTGQLLEARDSVSGAAGYPLAYGYMNVGRRTDGSRVFAFAPHQELFAAPPEDLLPLPEGIEPDDAVLYPSIETALQIVHDAAPLLGERVLVCGLGVIGLLVVELLRRGLHEVIATDPVASRRDRAAELGCRALDPASPTAAQEIRDAADGARPDIAINTSARGEALQLGLDALAHEGRAVEASWYGESRVNLDLGASFHRRRLTIRASQVSNLNPAMQPRWTRARRTAVAWRLVGELRPSRYITHRFPLDDAAAAYELIATHPERVLQVVLVP
ncbi:MAG: zinc-dependent alcohol dehydrogenase [Spirochaetota bacterium]